MGTAQIVFDSEESARRLRRRPDVPQHRVSFEPLLVDRVDEPLQERAINSILAHPLEMCVNSVLCKRGKHVGRLPLNADARQRAS